MKRIVALLLLALFLIPVLIRPAEAASPRLVDDAGLLSGGEAAGIEATLNEISARQGVDIVIVTTNSTGGKSPMEYADDYYDYNDYRADGIMLLVSMEESDWWVSTAGFGITAVTDAGLEYISDRFLPHLSEGEYATAFETFAVLCDEFITQAKTGDPYDSHNLPKEPFRFGLNLVIALAIGLVAAFCVTGNMKSKLKTVVQQTKADDYVEKGSLQLSYSRDLFLYAQLDKTEKEQSGSGSSTHTSSSGTTHGGGGGKF